MRILFLTDNYLPERNAPATRTAEHAAAWAAAGHEVEVITTAPNFPEGKLFAGYRNAWSAREVIDGVTVHRVKTYITANEGFLRRTLDYVSFMASGAAAALVARRPDVVITTSPQFFCAMAGWLVTRLRRVPWIFELRDLWPESIVAVGAMKRGRVIRWLERLEIRMYLDADAIVSVTEAFRFDLVQRGIAPEKIHVVLNGVDMRRYAPQPKDAGWLARHDLHGKFVVGYLGTHGMAHALDKVVEAAALLAHRPDIVFLFAGAGAKRAEVEARVAALGLRNVRLIESQPKSEMPGLWSVHDLALIPLRDQPLFTTVIPSKMFEALGMGVPILMSLPEGEATQLLRTTHAGVTVPPENPAAMAAAIEALADDPARLQAMRVAAAQAAPRFSRGEMAQRMLHVIAGTVREGVPGAASAASPGVPAASDGAIPPR
jgi:glycosyltransferase involved in cell wall biosynthesis